MEKYNPSDYAPIKDELERFYSAKQAYITYHNSETRIELEYTWQNLYYGIKSAEAMGVVTEKQFKEMISYFIGDLNEQI